MNSTWRGHGGQKEIGSASFFPYRDSSVLNSLWKESVEKEMMKILER